MKYVDEKTEIEIDDENEWIKIWICHKINTQIPL
jgi:hypothetical protein